MLTQTTAPTSVPESNPVSSSAPPPSGATPACLADLHGLLDAGLIWSGTYRTNLSNHLPMVWQALLELGASRERLQSWTETYGHLLEPLQVPRLTADMDASHLGRAGSEAAWRAHFGRRIDELGPQTALREALCLLMPGVGAVAFHGLIRTAHAVAAAHMGELAAALAHWAEHYEVLQMEPMAQELLWPQWLSDIEAHEAPVSVPAGLISHRLRAWSQAPGFARVASSLAIEDGSLRNLSLHAARAYAASGNFTLLHLVTACRAMGYLQPWWPEPMLPRPFTVAAAAALRVGDSGGSKAQPDAVRAERSWSELASAACAQDDAHVIKLVHAAGQLMRCWPDPVWQHAACRAIPV